MNVWVPLDIMAGYSGLGKKIPPFLSVTLPDWCRGRHIVKMCCTCLKFFKLAHLHLQISPSRQNHSRNPFTYGYMLTSIVSHTPDPKLPITNTLPIAPPCGHAKEAVIQKNYTAYSFSRSNISVYIKN